MKKLLFGVIAIVVCVGLIGSAFAQFTDIETSTDNTFTAGTLNLLIDDNPTGTANWVSNPDFSSAISGLASNLKPGDSNSLTIGIKNDGTISGTPSIKFSDIVNDDNGLTEPEQSEGDTVVEGELGANINVMVSYNGGSLLYNGPLNGFTTAVNGEPLPGGSTAAWNITLNIPVTAGNVIQSDTVGFKVVFGIDQS